MAPHRRGCAVIVLALASLACGKSDDDKDSFGVSTGPSTDTVGDGDGDGDGDTVGDGDGDGDTGDLPPPGSEMWGECNLQWPCGEGLVCAGNGPQERFWCTITCGMDPECSAPPGVSATAACISTEQGMVCALECQDTPDCPAGMVCTYHTVGNVCGWTWD